VTEIKNLTLYICHRGPEVQVQHISLRSEQGRNRLDPGLLSLGDPALFLSEVDNFDSISSN